jgi:hypothetical protein
VAKVGVDWRDLLVSEEEIELGYPIIQAKGVADKPINEIPIFDLGQVPTRKTNKELTVSSSIPLNKIEAILKLKNGHGSLYRLYHLINWEVALAKQLTITLNMHRRQALSLDRFAVSKGVRTLEKAGLIKVERQPGKSPRITVL